MVPIDNNSRAYMLNVKFRFLPIQQLHVCDQFYNHVYKDAWDIETTT